MAAKHGGDVRLKNGTTQMAGRYACEDPTNNGSFANMPDDG